MSNDCPRCNEPLVEYTLDERESYVCESCGFVGIDLDWTIDEEVSESWDDVMRRFYKRANSTEFQAVTHRSDEVVDPTEIDSDTDDTEDE